MVLPEPVLSDDDIKVAEEVIRNPESVMSSIWSKDPTKLAVLRALASFQARISPRGYSSWNLTYALAQKWGVFPSFLFIGSGGSALLTSFQTYNLGYFVSSLSRYPDFWRPFVSNVPEENQ